MKNIVLALFMMFIGISCVTQSKCLKKYPPTSTSDSTYIEKITLVPIYIEGDTFDVNVPIRCPDQEVMFVENSKLKQTIRILNGKLLSSTEIKPDTVRIPVKEILITEKRVEVPMPVKYVPQIYKISLYVCITLIVLIIAWIVKKFWI